MPALEPVLERLLPAKLGGPFRRVFSASLIANLGDGLLIAAGPLLVASLTDDPLLISLAAVASQLPWVVFSLFAGILADRVPRVRLMLIASWARALVLAAIVGLVATGTLTVPVLYLGLFLMGTCEVVLDTTWTSVVPDVVPREHLGLGNARLGASQLTMNQLAGPALGGVLFALGHALPYGAATATTLLAVACIAGLRLPQHEGETTGSIPVGGALARVRRELGSGFRWLWGHHAIRALAIILFAFNITYGMTWGVLVVYAHRILGLDATGYGLLMAVSAIGGLVGAGMFGWLERRFSYAAMMRVLLCIEVLMHFVFALTTSWIVAGAALFVFGAYAAVWMTISQTIRGRAVPSRMRGRVSSVYLLGLFGGVAIGSPIGGAIAQQAGVTATMWWAGIGTAVVLAIVWRMIPGIGAAGEHGPEGGAAPADSVA